MFTVIRWVEVRGMERGVPREVYLGVAKDERDRTLFGVCEDPGMGNTPVAMAQAWPVGEYGFDPEAVLKRTGEDGWFIFFDGTGLKVQGRELAVALYRLRLTDRLGRNAESVQLPTVVSPTTPPAPDQITVSATDLAEVLDKYTRGEAAQEGGALWRLRGAVARWRTATDH